ILERSGTSGGLGDDFWYWQRSGDPIDYTSRGRAPQYTAYENGTYYLRAYSTVTGCWSNPSNTITINNVILIPENPISNFKIYPNSCGSKRVTRLSNPQNGEEWYWQKAGNDYNISLGNSEDLIVDESGEYFLRAYREGCWSESISESVTLNVLEAQELPVIIFEGNSCFESEFVLSVSNYKVTDHIDWFLNGTKIHCGRSFPSERFNNESYTYQAVLTNEWGCSASANVTVDPIPSLDKIQNLPTYTYLSESTIELHSNNSSDGDLQFYWQESPDGIDENVYPEPRLVNEAKRYYLRYKNVYGCWSDPVWVDVPKFNPKSSSYPVSSIDFNRTIELIPRKEFNEISNLLNLQALAITQSAKFIDGFGRVRQNVLKSNSPRGKDLVAFNVYEGLSRVVQSNLIYPSNEINGELKNDAEEAAAIFYASAKNERYPFPYLMFENSNRKHVRFNYPSGLDYKIGDVKVSYKEHINNVNEVLFFDFEEMSNITVDHYQSNSLQKTGIEDEDGNQSWEYTNKLGQVVMKASEVEDGQLAQTYYIYDDLGKLRVVLPPEAVDRLTNEFFAGGSDRQAFLDIWAFQYTYDERGRMTEKKVPGSKKVLMIYDKWDRLVLTQDGNQRIAAQWLFTKYDGLNRPVITGIVDDYSTLIDDVMSETANRFETFGDPAALLETQYTDRTFPQDAHISEYLTITYYDNYDFVAASALSGTIYSCPDEFKGVNVDAYHLLPELQEQVKGQVTGTKTKILGTSDYLETITYYDDRYRVIQVVSENHLGGVDIISNQYDFVGNVRRVKSEHSDGTNTTSILLDYHYDHANRLLSCTHKLNDDPSVILYANEYNELGELIGKNLHYDETEESYKQQLDYEYNIRGWLRSINESSLSGESMEPEPADLFSIELLYNTSLPNQPNN
ncbi:DUF6443 domain-containing protein, partial [Ekhidna sp.]|uniref:DUF6443 domain-containing protein n=1 Tax=Ekhidna sp. TaxID=2608089 RepID=UPI0032EE9CCF